MNWFVYLIQLIDKATGIGENYSFLIACGIIAAIATVIVVPVMNLLRK